MFSNVHNIILCINSFNSVCTYESTHSLWYKYLLLNGEHKPGCVVSGNFENTIHYGQILHKQLLGTSLIFFFKNLMDTFRVLPRNHVH